VVAAVNQPLGFCCMLLARNRKAPRSLLNLLIGRELEVEAFDGEWLESSCHEVQNVEDKKS